MPLYKLTRHATKYSLPINYSCHKHASKNRYWRDTGEQGRKARGGEKKQDNSANLTFKAVVFNGRECEAVCSINAP